jgi:hypothetical protein
MSCRVFEATGLPHWRCGALDDGPWPKSRAARANSFNKARMTNAAGTCIAQIAEETGVARHTATRSKVTRCGGCLAVGVDMTADSNRGQMSSGLT